jgi:alkylation response protein AidB-like acyl-CoA dehydrogenase
VAIETADDAAGRELEPVDDFRERARAWLAESMPIRDRPYDRSDERRWDRGRVLQRILWDGGFAGICFPVAYGGLGLTPAHQRAFNEVADGYELPQPFNIPTRTIVAPTLLEFGTEAQLQRHIPAILRGDEYWVQFLSEPTGGSDMASALTRATRDGDVFVVNGSKIWSSSADQADYALLLCRTNWDVPKHRGLSVLIMEVHQPGVTVQRIRGVGGSPAEFCQEFFDDVTVPAENIVGEVDDGWTVASRILFHERAAVGGGSPYMVGRQQNLNQSGPQRDLVELAQGLGTADDPHVRELLGEAHAMGLIGPLFVQRVLTGMRSGHFPAAAGSLLRLMAARSGVRRSDISMELAGAAGVAWDEEGDAGGAYGRMYLGRQGGELAGGSTEMQRNLISERLLGMPREPAPDRDVPFRDVRTNELPGR